jgi:type I restriction enzyme S subunit
MSNFNSNNFIQTTLGELVSKEKKSIISGPFGSNIGKIFFKLEGIPVIRGNNLSTGGEKFKDNGFVFITREKADELNCYAIKNDLIFTAVGTIGQVGIIDEKLKYDEYVISNKQLRVRFDNTKITPLFAYYWFSSYWIQKLILQRNVGSTVPLINLSVLKGLPISLPKSLKIQNNIVEVLENIFSKIEINNRINSELEAMAKTLYDYWFVQFDFPDANGKPYKISGGKMVWNAELKREIPEGWEVKELGDILNTDLGGTPSTKIEKFWGGNIPWLNSGEIANFPIVESEAHITSEAISNSATTLMPAGTCVLSITRHLRPSILAIDACANQSVVGIFESEKFKSSFIYPYLKNEIPRLMTLRSGAQQPHINKGTVDESLMINPSTIVVEKYYKKANPIYKQIINNSFQNQELASLRDWLLPMLMNGQVRVGEVEEELGMVAESGEKYGK